MVDEIRDHLGEVRRLGYVAPDPSKQLLRAARTNIQTIRSNAGLPPLIPQAQWQEVDYITGYPATLINDQKQFGACVGASCVGASQRQRYMRTGVVTPLSWAFVYDQINGGTDNGANIIDSMQVIEKVGAPKIADYSPVPIFKQNQIASTVQMFPEDVAITVTDSDECATALMMGMLCQAPIYANNTFEHFTGDGVAWNDRPPKGNASNHSIYLAGLKKIGATWYFILVNSWTANWGPTKQGWCLCPLAAIDNPSMADDGYAHASTAPVSGGQSAAEPQA